jgi:hypothetical protein
LTDRTLDNRGTITWSTGGALLMGGSATLSNAAGATISLAADMSMQPFGNNATPSLLNAGTLTKSGGSGTSALGIPLTNNGTITATAGAFSFSNGGQAVPAVTNGGQLTPSQTPTRIGVTGDYTQTANGALNLKLGPSTTGAACTQAASDVLAVSGAVGLAGTLNVTTVGCTPNIDFTMLTFASRTGQFAPPPTSQLPSGYRFIQYPTTPSPRVIITQG